MEKQNAGFVSGDCCGGICSVFLIQTSRLTRYYFNWLFLVEAVVAALGGILGIAGNNQDEDSGRK